jgi:hypothetical protein
MDAVDGNAIAGPLFAHFGTEMTAARGTWLHCGYAPGRKCREHLMRGPKQARTGVWRARIGVWRH